MCLRILAALGALLLAACSGDPISAREGARRKIFLVNIKSDIGFLDLQRSNSVADHQVHLSLSEGLIAESRESDRAVEPGVAEKWEPNADSSVWTFHLRQNAKWSDGTPLTAHDFVWSWRRMLQKQLASEYSRMLFLLKGGEAFYQKNGTPDENMDAPDGPGVRAVDDHTLEVTLTGPTPHFPHILCHTSWWPVPGHVIKKYGSIADVMNPWTEEANMVGNGPFKLKRRLFRQYVEVERNPHYWDAATVKLDGVRFYPISIEQTEEKLFRRGQLHATYSVPLNKVAGYLSEHPDVVKNYTNCATWFFRCNTTRGPFQNIKVRRAMSMALDRQGLIDRVLRANQKPAEGIVPPLEDYDGAKDMHFNPEEAKKLLAEAGYPNGEGFPTGSAAMKLLTQKSESASQIAEAVQAMWQQYLGIRIAIIQMDSNVYLDTQHKMDYDIALAGWNADYYDPATFLDMWITDGGNNETGWSNKAYDQLIVDAGQCTDAAKRLGILRQAEELFLKEAPVLPVYYATRTRLIHPAVKEWQPRLLDNRLWKYMDLVYPPPPCSMDDELAHD